MLTLGAEKLLAYLWSSMMLFTKGFYTLLLNMFGLPLKFSNDES